KLQLAACVAEAEDAVERGVEAELEQSRNGVAPGVAIKAGRRRSEGSQVEVREFAVIDVGAGGLRAPSAEGCGSTGVGPVALDARGERCAGGGVEPTAEIPAGEGLGLPSAIAPKAVNADR